MKFLSVLAFAGLASAATLKVKRDDIDAAGEVKLPDLSPNSEFTIENKKYKAVGVEDNTNVTVFQLGADWQNQYYALEFSQGPKVSGLTVGSDGVCKGCRNDAGNSITEGINAKRELMERDGVGEADLEKRFFLLHLIGGIIGFKLKLLGGIVKSFTYGCFNGYYKPIHIHRPHGGHGHGHNWCGVGPNGYIHWPNVHIGCSNGLGGHYVGCTEGGMQLWQWGDGSVCPIYVRRGRRLHGWNPHHSNHGGQWWWKRDQIEASEE